MAKSLRTALRMLARLPLPPPELPSAGHGPYNLDTTGALHAAVQSHSRGGELILLHLAKAGEHTGLEKDLGHAESKLIACHIELG